MNDQTVSQIVADLSYAYDGVFTPDEVTDAVAAARDLLEPKATVAGSSCPSWSPARPASS